jgi:hypothetical protein
MTSEERLDRIEHITAGIAEERRKDREEYKALWRDTERHMNEFSVGLVELRQQVSDLAVRFQEQADDWRAADRALREQLAGTDARIAALVSALGEHLRLGHPQR